REVGSCFGSPSGKYESILGEKETGGFAILGLEQTANSVALDQYNFPTKTVLVLGREKEGIPVEIIHMLDTCIEIPQLGVVRSLNVHVSGAIALWEYTRQQRLH
ncbi:UNVERIFIED_CONTAM: putative methyltransferase TARBP1, partial [Sesamum angustifolium]